MNMNEFKKIVSESKSFSSVSKKIYGNIYCGNRQTIKKRIIDHNIDISHFDFKPTGLDYKGRFTKIPLVEILISGSTYTHNANLKRRLYDEGLKEPICEKCGQDEWWNDEKITLILDHINGNNTDQRIKNLKILCPNCNATLPTHGGKNAKLKSESEKKKYYTLLSDNEKQNINKKQSFSQRKVKRPPYIQLVSDVSLFGYSATGRKYGVSDNAIRKWIRFYEKYEIPS